MSVPNSPKFWVIIPAAGVGSRMQAAKPKQYLELHKETILFHTLNCFLSHPAFTQVIVGISREDNYFAELGLDRLTDVEVFLGGRERADTVLNGLKFIAPRAAEHDWIWVHDAARPCLSHHEINLMISSLEHESVGCILAVPLADTIKRVIAGEQIVQETVDRTGLWRAMTPQVFRYAELRQALEFCQERNLVVTDESSAIEHYGLPVKLVQGSADNIKVTLPDDLHKVGMYLALKNRETSLVDYTGSEFPRIGTGFDVHAFAEGDFVTLGGVRIPYENGLLAHSDGDVLLHAIMDAMLGALALGDIGKHFPDTDAQWKGADSRKLLKAVNQLITEKGYRVGNIDSTIIAQAPKMAPYIGQMQAFIADDLSIAHDSVGVKATTTEKLGFTGRKEGIACQASVILIPVKGSLNV